MSFDLMHFFANGMQVSGFYQKGEWKKLSIRLTLLRKIYIHFSFVTTCTYD